MKMWLIDANELVDKGFCFSRAAVVGEKDIVMLPLSDVLKSVVNSPTVDAIPVGWLRSQMTCTKPEDTVDSIRNCVLDYYIDKWHKEQDEYVA